MRRAIAVLLGLAVSSVWMAIGPAVGPADAALCGGQGAAFLNKNIGLPVIGAVSNVGFTITAACTINSGSPSGGTASGNIASASCGRSTGGTGSIFGRAFVFQTAGSMGLIQASGGSGVKGVFNAVSDPRVANNSCASGTAHQFLVTSVIKGPW